MTRMQWGPAQVVRMVRSRAILPVFTIACASVIFASLSILATLPSISHYLSPPIYLLIALS